MKISVATCHFPVDADISRNEKYVVSQVRSAREFGADVAHFPEACLSGYAGTDFASYRGFDWPRLEAATLHILDVAKQTGLWVILGSTHRLTGRHKPHDCVYIIDSSGRLADRYDKMFCSGDGNGRSGDLAHYSPGNHFTTFTLKGIRCGVLICYEYAFPELYREYKRRGVQLVFHSFHAGHASRKTVKSMAREVGVRFHRLNAGSRAFSFARMASSRAACGETLPACSCQRWTQTNASTTEHVVGGIARCVGRSTAARRCAIGGQTRGLSCKGGITSVCSRRRAVPS